MTSEGRFDFGQGHTDGRFFDRLAEPVAPCSWFLVVFCEDWFAEVLLFVFGGLPVWPDQG